MSARRGARGFRAGIAAALALYALTVAVSPVLHHDLACHLNSPKHCTACTASPAAPRAEPHASFDAQRLPEAGPVDGSSSRPAHDVCVIPSSGRSPPA